MPTHMQGDIFAEALDNRYDLAIVFGHLGLNEMELAWRQAQSRVPEWRGIRDPFNENALVHAEGQTPLWRFVAAEENHGMTDERFRQNVQVLFDEARQNRATTVITNGISDVDYGMLMDANRASDDRRVRLINDIMAAYEGQGFRVSLISLNDAYTRNFPQQGLRGDA